MPRRSRDARRRLALLALTLLLAIGLGAASPAHEALHADEEGAHVCAFCHVSALEAPTAPLVVAPAPAHAPLRAPHAAPERVVPRVLFAPRAPPRA